MKQLKPIIQVETIELSKVHSCLKEQVMPVYGRIQSKQYLELFVSTNTNEVIEDIGISWHNPIHPTAKYIKFISLSPNEALLNELLKTIEPFNKVIYCCYENQFEEIALLLQKNFQLFRKTYMEIYEIDNVLDRIQNEFEEGKLVSLQHVLENPFLKEELFQLVKHNYEQTHLDNEAKDMAWQIWYNLLLADEPHLQLSKVIVTDEEIIGYLFVHVTSNQHCEMGWMGRKRSFNLIAIIKKILVEMKEEQFLTVEFEIDTTDYVAYELADLLELQHKLSWNSYVLK